jgi:putative spermidine/putrescine transport system ATP-binding protein
VEQAGPPTEVYERPASAFVAGFVGTSNIIDGVSVRPEKISIGGEGPRGVEGTVDELVYTGATTRCVVTLDDGTALSVLLLNGAGATTVPARGERVRLTWHPEHEIQLKEAP